MMTPYISPPRREAQAHFRNAVKDFRIDTPGELEYLLCWTCDQYCSQHPLEFSMLNSVVGALENAKMEFYRKVVGNFEDKKELANGPLWGEIDKEYKTNG